MIRELPVEQTGGTMLFQRGKSYSLDLRERVFAAAADGSRVGQIARALRVSVSYVSKVLSRRNKTGETTARPQRCHLTPRLADLHQAIRRQVATRPDATIAELRAWLLATREVAVSDGLMCETLAKLDLTLKKSRFAPRDRRMRLRPAAAIIRAPLLCSNLLDAQARCLRISQERACSERDLHP